MQPSSIPPQTLAGRWASQLRHKVDGYESQLQSDLPEVDQHHLSDLPEEDRHSHGSLSGVDHDTRKEPPKHYGSWHTRSSNESWQPGHIVSRSNAENPKMEALLHKRTSEVPVKQRTVGRLRHLRMKLLVNVAHRIINLLTKTDELLIKIFHGNPNDKVSHDFPSLQRTVRKQSTLKRLFLSKGKPQSEPVERDTLEQATRRPDVIERLIEKERASTQTVRQSALGPVIAENTEDLVGVVYPGGIPREELKLYTNPRLVVIKDGATNEYGHALLAFGNSLTSEDRYVQISSANWYPEHLDGTQFKEYLSKWGNEIAYEVHLGCTDEERMREKLNELSSTRWLWGGPRHNCMTFCKVIGDAGGASEDLYKGLTTISNRVSTNVLQGFQTGMFMAVRELKEPYQAQEGEQAENPEMLQKLKHFEELVAEKLLGTPYGKTMESMFVDELTRTEHMEKMFRKISGCLEEAGIPEELHESMQLIVESMCQREVINSMERGDRDFHEFDVRHLADLPLASVYNAPVKHRVVGPQSLAEAFKDPEGIEKDSIPYVRMPIHRVVSGGHLAKLIGKLSGQQASYAKDLRQFQANYTRALEESEDLTIYAEDTLNPENIDEATGEPVVSPDNHIWKWPEVTKEESERMTLASHAAMITTMDEVLKSSTLPEDVQGRVKAKVHELCSKAVVGDLESTSTPRESGRPLLRDLFPFTRHELLERTFAPYKSEHKEHIAELEYLHTTVSVLVSGLRVQLALNSPSPNHGDAFVEMLNRIRGAFTESRLPEPLRNEVGVAIIKMLKEHAGHIDVNSAVQRFQRRQAREQNRVVQDVLQPSSFHTSEQAQELRERVELAAARRKELDEPQDSVFDHSSEPDSDDDSLLQLPEWKPVSGHKPPSASAVSSDENRRDRLQSPLFRKCYSRAVEKFSDHSDILSPLWSQIGNEFMDLELAYLLNKPEAEREQESKALKTRIEKRLLLTDLPSDVVGKFSDVLIGLFQSSASSEIKPLRKGMLPFGKKLQMDSAPALSDSLATLINNRPPELSAQDLLRRHSDSSDSD